MLYIKIGDNKYPAEFSTFPTQKGNTAVRVKSDAPIASGFLIVDESDKVVTDYSSFTFLYREDGDVKEYTEVEEIPIPTSSSKTGVPISPIERQIQSLNKRVTSITPYEQTKIGYFGENEKVFYGVPQGNVSVFFSNYTGEYDTERILDRLTITFYETVENDKKEKVRQKKRLTDMTNITVMIQQ